MWNEGYRRQNADDEFELIKEKKQINDIKKQRDQERILCCCKDRLVNNE